MGPTISSKLYRVQEFQMRRLNPHLYLVEMSGFEPPTPCVQGRCSPAELHPLPHFRFEIYDFRLEVFQSTICNPKSEINGGPR